MNRLNGWGKCRAYMGTNSEGQQLNPAAQVHIIPVGYEEDRIVQPPVEAYADKVILLLNSEDDDLLEFQERAIEKVEANIREVEKRRCRIFDLYESLREFAECLDEHENDAVYVNLATGSKVTAIGGMIACMAVGGNPYYVPAGEYGNPEEEGPPDYAVAHDAQDPVELPQYPIDSPSAQEIAIIGYISRSERPVNKKQLIDFSIENDLPFIRRYKNSKRQAQYRVLEEHVLSPLRNRDCINVNTQGRDRIVELTKHGENTYTAFKYLIDSPT